MDKTIEEILKEFDKRFVEVIEPTGVRGVQELAEDIETFLRSVLRRIQAETREKFGKRIIDAMKNKMGRSDHFTPDLMTEYWIHVIENSITPPETGGVEGKPFDE
jgi:hypothetical protein